jgi:hypothetical protein
MSSLLLFYGFFLIACGITAVTFIGSKAKTALISGGTSGILAIMIGYFYCSGNIIAVIAGILLPAVLFIVFCWRASKTFFTLLDMAATQNSETHKKAIAFLIIGMMAIISLVVVMFQVHNFFIFC